MIRISGKASSIPDFQRRWETVVAFRCSEIDRTSTAMLADQLTSEYRVRTQGRGRECDEWKLRPGNDNHLFDCIVGFAVGASIQGVSLAETGSAAKVAGPKRVSFADLQRRKQAPPARPGHERWTDRAKA